MSATQATCTLPCPMRRPVLISTSVTGATVFVPMADVRMFLEILGAFVMMDIQGTSLRRTVQVIFFSKLIIKRLIKAK